MVEYTPVEYEAVEYREEKEHVTIDYEEFTRYVRKRRLVIAFSLLFGISPILFTEVMMVEI